MDDDLKNNMFRDKLDIRKNYDLFGSDNHENLHWGKLFIHLFGEYFSKYSIIRRVNNKELVNCLIRRYSLEQSQILRVDRVFEETPSEVNYEESEVLLILKQGFMFSIINNRIDLMYGAGISENEKNEVIKLVDEFKIDFAKVKKFHMVQRYYGNLELTDFDIKPFTLDISTNYNDDFLSIHNLITKSFTTKEKNGIVLLHGKLGTGKTYYIRHLINNIDRKFIYFPLDMIESISSPEFLPFISQQPNSILILEDCENLLVHRDNYPNNASAVSNLLNLGDGLLSDALSINIICTFNSGLKKIDDAILRKGRLLARYEFKELELSKAQGLAQKLGKVGKIDHLMTVSDIYNLDETNFENAPKKKVGFKKE